MFSPDRMLAVLRVSAPLRELGVEPDLVSQPSLRLGERKGEDAACQKVTTTATTKLRECR